MKRRSFIKKMGFAAGAPIAFQGIPLKLMASHESIRKVAAASDNDKVLVIIQMHGGNDGLNTLIPLDNYAEYQSRRANIAIPYKVGTRTAIPLDSTIPSADQVGLHPDMHDFKSLYDGGKAAVFQGVSYANNNGSHFRGRDIYNMGGDGNDYFPSGWVGRYLGKLYTDDSGATLNYPEDFPNDDMPDPLALEMGNDVSLLFHQEDSIPTSISISGNPSSLEQKIEELDGFGEDVVDTKGIPPASLEGSPYNEEMDWILGLEDKTEEYITRLAEIYESASETSVTYPENYPFVAPTSAKDNPLSSQLQLVARLLGGGVKTKVFLLKIGGFDTHAEQVEADDATMGLHSTLLYHISSAMRAFQNDLRARGIEDRVLTFTMSEFGRRIASNGSYGSDHGEGGPIMMFGAGVKPGVYGTVPDLSQKNVGLQFDYRQIYANVLYEWMDVDKTTLTNEIFFKNFIDGENIVDGGTYEPMDLIKDVILGEEHYINKNYQITSVYPNPASNYTQAKIFVNNYQNVVVQLIDSKGRTVSQVNRQVAPGEHTFSFVLNGLSAGFYFIKAKSEMLDDTKKLIIQ